jgi:hypothetical protein
MLTLKTVNREVQKKFPGYELLKGNGYFYVHGHNSHMWNETMIYTYRLNHMTLDQWIDSVTHIINKNVETI